MNCAYHPDRPAVNTCSKCRQPVCASCNYITGTAPICRKCWEKIEQGTMNGGYLTHYPENIPPVTRKPAGFGIGKTILFVFLGLVVLSTGGWLTYRTFFPPPEPVNIWQAKKPPQTSADSIAVKPGGMQLEESDPASILVNALGVPGSSGHTRPGKLILITSDIAGIKWFNNYGDNSDELCYDVIEASDGSLVTCGSWYVGGKYGFNGMLLKTDKDGSIKRIQKWNGLGDQEYKSLRETPDGGFILCGLGTNEETGKKNLLLVKTDAEAKEIWTKTIGGNQECEGRCIRLAADGGFIIGGQITPEGGKYEGPWVIKTDQEGNVIWENRFTEKNGTMGSVACIQETSDGGYTGAGFIFVGTDIGYGVGWQFLLDANGKFIAETEISHNGATMEKSLIETPEGDIAVAGLAYTDKSGNESNGVISLLSSDGKVKWLKEYNDCQAYSIIRSSDGGFISCGCWYNLPVPASSKMQLWIHKVSRSGEEVWDCTGYTDKMENVSGAAIIKTADGGYVVAGQMVVDRQSDILLLKMYPDGQK